MTDCHPARVTNIFFRFDMIFFTGGPRIGKFVMKAAAEYLTPVILELGGKNPVWVDPSADIHRTARSIIWAKTTNTGMSYRPMRPDETGQTIP